jgi:hypothetical protein
MLAGLLAGLLEAGAICGFWAYFAKAAFLARSRIATLLLHFSDRKWPNSDASRTEFGPNSTESVNGNSVSTSGQHRRHSRALAPDNRRNLSKSAGKAPNRHC